MPGVPFSKACERCKARRVKCDERKPDCTQCLRLGKGPCPGYRASNKFIDEGVRLQKKRAAAASNSNGASRVSGTAVGSTGNFTIGFHGDDLSNSSSQSSSSNGSPFPQKRHGRSISDAFASPGQGSSSSATASTASPLRDLAVLASSPIPPPVGALFEETARLGFEVMLLSPLTVVHCGRLKSCIDVLGGSPMLASTLAKANVMPSFVWYIPTRLGVNPVLDTAVDLVFTAAGHLLTPPSRTKRVELTRKYIIALTHLQQAIRDPYESMSVDTLAAVSLLSSWECLYSTSLVAWINHQRGIYQLVEKRGPSRYRTDFERQLLIAGIGTIFTIAVRDDHPCFLEQPEWHEIIFTKPPDSMIVTEWTETYQCLPQMCMIPRLLSTCRRIVRNKSWQTADTIEALVASTTVLKRSFVMMSEKFNWTAGRFAPMMAARDTSDSWRVFCDAEDMAAENYCNYLSAVAILNRILFALRPSSQHLELEARTAAMEIQYLHSFIKTEPALQNAMLIHSERVALAVLLTSNFWMAERSQQNGPAADGTVPGGGNIVEQAKFDKFDDILCARVIDAPLLLHYPAAEGQSKV